MQEWLQELHSSITSLSELKKHFALTKEESEVFNSCEKRKFRITPHIINLIKYNDADGKIRKQFIPSIQKVTSLSEFEDDYLHEADNEVCDNLVIRYPHKAILLVTHECPAYCQFCTRSRIIGKHTKIRDLSAAYMYLTKHPEIYDIVITGGDPLILEDCELENIFQKLREIKSIKLIRLNTRIPVTLPKRVNKSLIDLLKKYNINYMNIHFEHPDEISAETIDACLNLADNGILLGSQSVLLNQINDNKEILKTLFLRLLSIKVRPYYLYQCDKVDGCQSFYVSPRKGISLINSILEELPGLCIPRFVIDSPDKMGKITVAPNGLISLGEDSLQLKNYYNGNEYTYKL